MSESVTIAPQFNGDVEYAAAAFRDYFLLQPGTDIPVTKVTITVNGEKRKFVWNPGSSTAILFLLYCAAMRHSTSFEFDEEMKKLLRPVFGEPLLRQARESASADDLLAAMISGTTIAVQLALRHGFVLPQGPGRSMRKLVEHGWRLMEANQLHHDSPVPLVREAVEQFLAATRNGSTKVAPRWRSEYWPNTIWQDRVWVMNRLLGRK